MQSTTFLTYPLCNSRRLALIFQFLGFFSDMNDDYGDEGNQADLQSW